MITVHGKVHADGGLIFDIPEAYPVAGHRYWRGRVDQATGHIVVWDDRDYIAGWPCWRQAKVNQSNGKIELQVPRYEQMWYQYYGVYSGFASNGPYSPPPDPPPAADRYAQVQTDAYTSFLSKTGRVNEDAFKHGDTNGVNGQCRCWFRSGYQSYTITAAAKANPLDVQLRIAGKHYYRIYDGSPPTMGRVDSGQVTLDWNEGPYGMYSGGQDFVNRHSPDATVTMADSNSAWAATGTAWDAAPDSACYRTITIPPAFLTAMSGTSLCFWFLLSNTAFPWRHDTIGTAEDMGVFFGSLWVLR